MDGSPLPSFNEQVDAHATRLGLNDYKLSLAIGLLPGNTGFSPTQVGRLRKGKQRPTAVLITRLVELFKLDDDDDDALWFAAGMIPGDWDYDTFRRAARDRRQQLGREGIGWPDGERRSGGERRRPNGHHNPGRVA